MIDDIMNSPTYQAIYEFFEPMWVEICFALFFPLGWHLVHKVCFKNGDKAAERKRPSRGGPAAGGQKSGAASARQTSSAAAERLQLAVEEAIAGNDSEKAVAMWREARAGVAANTETLRLVVRPLMGMSPGTVVEEVLQHFEQHKILLSDPKASVAVLEVLSHQVALMSKMHKALQETFHQPMTGLTYEALLGGHAAAGDEARVGQLLAEMQKRECKLTPRGHALIIKGLLMCGRLDSALVQVAAMRKQGFYVPPFALSMLLKVARQAGRMAEVFDNVKSEVAASGEALSFLFEDCARSSDIELATQMEALARSLNSGQLPHACYGPLLRTNIVVGNVHAMALLEEVQKLNVKLTDGCYIFLLSRCADTKFLRFAEELARVIRTQHGGLTISMYSALMKVYAYCGLYGRACDLYDEILSHGLQPDAVMQRCLMKFAGEAGRTDLLQRLFNASSQPSIQSYMCIIRAAGREKNVNRAFEILNQLSSSGLKVDRGVYNCVLDACVCAGDLKRARSFLAELREQQQVDIVSYNTLLKGYCALGDMRSASELFAELGADGLKADEYTFNCMINTAVTGGNLRKAWELVDQMESSGATVDKYTVSIMLKALKAGTSQRDLRRALALLDRVGLDLCSDGTLLNIAIETCVRHKEMRRLQELVAAWEGSSLQPGVHTYAALIKACGVLKNVNRCRSLWRQMVEERGTEPNDVVLGCYLDALVCNGMVTEAVATFREWRGKVGTNMILYATLIKGFAAQGMADEAMEMWREIRAEAGQMNTIVYNSLIDVQARVGNMERSRQLFTGMEDDGVHPDSITWSTMVKGHCTAGSLDDAFQMFRSAQKAGMAPDCIVYNTILDGCTRHNRTDLADLVLQDFETNSIVPSNFTLGILVKMWGRRRRLEKAFEVLATLPQKYGLTPNIQVKTCLISACICNGAIDRGMEVFNDMKAQGEGSVDSKAYGVLISGFLRAGWPEKAAKLVEDAYGLHSGQRMLPRGQHIAPENLEHLMKALGNAGMQEHIGVPLLENLRKVNVPLNGRLLSSAMRH